jgi:hypothetical protein
LHRKRGGRVKRHDDIYLERDKLDRKFRKSVQPSFRRTKLECNVLPLYITEFTQSYPELLLE